MQYLLMNTMPMYAQCLCVCGFILQLAVWEKLLPLCTKMRINGFWLSIENKITPYSMNVENAIMKAENSEISPLGPPDYTHSPRFPKRFKHQHKWCFILNFSYIQLRCILNNSNLKRKKRTTNGTFNFQSLEYTRTLIIHWIYNLLICFVHEFGIEFNVANFQSSTCQLTQAVWSLTHSILYMCKNWTQRHYAYNHTSLHM